MDRTRTREEIFSDR